MALQQLIHLLTRKRKVNIILRLTIDLFAFVKIKRKELQYENANGSNSGDTRSLQDSKVNYYSYNKRLIAK